MNRKKSIQVYLTPEEKQTLGRLIKAEGLSESSFTRRLLLGHIRDVGVTVESSQHPQTDRAAA